jgi:hypothetical protein
MPSTFIQAIRGYGRMPAIGRFKKWSTGKLDRRRKLSDFKRKFAEFSRLTGSQRLMPKWKDRYACIDDDTGVTDFDRHYVYHPAWAARILTRIHPEHHFDIGSSLFFVSVISAFTDVKFYDYRPADLRLSGLEVLAADVADLQFEDRSIRSLSCMHVVEHIGLGRYGDSLDPDGDLKAMKELQRVLSVGGDLLFVVPVGQPKVIFNAHRVYSLGQIVEQFPELILKEFALIPERGPEGLVIGASEERVSQEEYACGCFWFSRGNEALESSGEQSA